MENVIYMPPQQITQSPPDSGHIAQHQDPSDPGQKDSITQDLIPEFDLMQLNDLTSVTPTSTKKLPLKSFETFNKLTNSFIPDLTKLVQDTEEIGRTTHLTAEGVFYTTKQVRKPSAFLKNIKKQETLDNTSMHKDQRQIKDTYDVYLNLADFTAYENNIMEKLNFLEVNMRKCKGYIETYHAAKDKQLLVKFDSYEAMRYAVSMFN